MRALARFAFLLPVVAGIVLLVVAEFSPLYEIRVITAVPEGGGPFTAGSNHNYALLVIALVSAVMAFGAVRGGSRAASIALVVLGVAALLVCLLADLPDVRDEGLLRETYEQAKASPLRGFYLETLGSVLLLVGGVGLLLFGRSDEGAPPRRSRRTRDASAPAAEPAGPEG